VVQGGDRDEGHRTTRLIGSQASGKGEERLYFEAKKKKVAIYRKQKRAHFSNTEKVLIGDEGPPAQKGKGWIESSFRSARRPRVNCAGSEISTKKTEEEKL